MAPVISGTLLLAGCATTGATPQPAPPAAAPATPPPAMQWLYGSGEAGALSIQAFHAFRDHALGSARSRPRDSVVLAAGASPASPRWVPCGDKPPAVVLDADETVLLNLGYEYDEALTGRTHNRARRDRYERTGVESVAPVPGAVTALRALRQAGITVIFNTNRLAANAAETARSLEFAGLGPAREGETLFLADERSGSGKDGRRAVIAERFCVVAMAGDQLGDFSDAFNERALTVTERRRLATSGDIAGLWGNGWFLLPNPVYGPGLRGTCDEVFPADRRWTDIEGGE
ncbi:MAG TPA: HAD family acid phosphatase [Allosphingosinicella sp.]